MTSNIKIGLWGAPGSGKTTYIGALDVAASNTVDYGNWKIISTGPAMTYLRERRNELVLQRMFPAATLQKSVPLRWQFTGELPRGRRRNRVIQFDLELIDAPGGLFGPTKLDSALIDYITSCDGLVFLFDPTAEIGLGGAQTDVNFEHFKDVLSEVSSRVGLDSTARLPHFLAVCITKFDDAAIFHSAKLEAWISQDREGARLPRVPDERAAGFFEWICNRFPGGTAQLVRDNIRSYFHPNRVRYFAVSSIGFKTNAEHIVDIDNCLNLNSRNGQKELVQRPNPVNVLEPLIWLEGRISGGRP
jgi:GTPase SAR1 family protein